MPSIVLLILLSILLMGCNVFFQDTATFGDDLAVLKAHTDVIVLRDATGHAQIAVVPLYQGRVMTSTAEGLDGPSFGWINHELIAANQKQAQINVFGGEDRFWLGPEGGQFSLYFAPGSTFDFVNWQVPEPLDWGGWTVVEKQQNRVRFRQPMTLINYSNFTFHMVVDREVRLLDRPAIGKALTIDVPTSVSVVGYESNNQVTNVGTQPWQKQTGLVSIWILGMYTPSPSTICVLPFRTSDTSELGPVVNDAYFGAVPADRLAVDYDAGVIVFRGDGRHRSKIGISPQRAKPVMGGYDPKRGVLTIVQYNLPDDAADRPYVNSMWEMQNDPYAGDVVNSYNDGPNDAGTILGPFYELESSSPAASLAPGESLQHLHRTIHLLGDRQSLDTIARHVLGVSLERIINALD